MSSDIKAGDLVIVTGAGCVHAQEHIGQILEVFDISHNSTSGCRKCGVFSRSHPKSYRGTNVIFNDGGKFMGKPISWVKKIDPLTEPETVTERDEVEA